jgi:hypothetical protein
MGESSKDKGEASERESPGPADRLESPQEAERVANEAGEKMDELHGEVEDAAQSIRDES